MKIVRGEGLGVRRFGGRVSEVRDRFSDLRPLIPDPCKDVGLDQLSALRASEPITEAVPHFINKGKGGMGPLAVYQAARIN